MFDRETFAHFHNTNVNTGFNPSTNRYDGYVQDAEGKPWGYIKSLNLYEQAETGIRKDPAQFQLMNIDILGYSDGGGPTIIANYDTYSDGIYGRTGDQILSSESPYAIVQQTSSAFGVSLDILQVSENTSNELVLREGSGSPTDLNPAPNYIGFFVSGPTKGWFIGKNSHENGNTYDFFNSSNGETEFPPRGITVEQPLAVAFYSGEPVSVNNWSDYTT